MGLRRLIFATLSASALLVGHPPALWAFVRDYFPTDPNNFKVEDFAEAQRLWQPLAEKGQPEAQVILGYIYKNRPGDPKDKRTAVNWFLKAAKQGNATAEANLGLMYAKGLGVQYDLEIAGGWFHKAAEQGNAFAQKCLGYMYQIGLGVTQDDTTAVSWYGKAAEQGDADAQARLGDLYSTMVLSEEALRVQAAHNALFWLRKAAEQGDPNGLRRLGDQYYIGVNSVPQSYENAIIWYRKAADLGDVQSQSQLGLSYENGVGVAQDYVLAHMWYNLSASKDWENRDILAKKRDSVAGKMTPAQIAEAQALARDWKPKTGK
jgi:TPR repeat protein